MFVLIFSIMGSGASAFLGWFLNYCKVNYNAPSQFGEWSIFFYICAVVVLIVGLIIFINNSVIFFRSVGTRRRHKRRR